MARFWTVMVLAILLAGCSPELAPRPEATDTAVTPSSTTAAPPAAAGGDMIQRALSAAPADIAANAAVEEAGPDGQMKEVRAGTNGWVCMAHPQVMCVDRQWQEWADAWVNKRQPKVSGVGIAYMLQGDTGASNTDPFATAETPDNQWVVAPAHIMVLTSDTAQLDALPTDPSNGGPWVMWKGTPYAHIMVPVEPMKR